MSKFDFADGIALTEGDGLSYHLNRACAVAAAPITSVPSTGNHHIGGVTYNIRAVIGYWLGDFRGRLFFRSVKLLFRMLVKVSR